MLGTNPSFLGPGHRRRGDGVSACSHDSMVQRQQLQLKEVFDMPQESTEKQTAVLAGLEICTCDRDICNLCFGQECSINQSGHFRLCRFMSMH